MRTLLVFAKEPRPGGVKTRLAASIGDENAHRIYKAFLNDLEKILGKFKDVNIQWWIDGNKTAFEQLLGKKCFRQQCPGDLGKRLQHAFSEAFKESSGPCAAIGADCPLLNCSHIDKLFTTVERGADVGIIPARDGGYAAISTIRPIARIFDSIPWSTDQVLSTTLDTLKKQNLTVDLFPEIYDVDTFDDLVLLMRDLKDDEKSAPETYREILRIMEVAPQPGNRQHKQRRQTALHGKI